MTVLSSFYEALNKEEKKFLPNLANDNLGLLMRCAINELDWFYYNYARSDQPTLDQQEQLYILQIGVARLIKLALESRDSFDVPVVTTVRNRELLVMALEIASALGMIQHGRRVAQSVASGTASIEQAGPNEFVITIPEEVEDEDYYEKAVLAHYNTELRRRFQEVMREKKWKKVEKKVNKTLHDLVYPWREHFIGYDADPILDDYFFGLATFKISLEEGYDTYRHDTKFGGIKIQSYMLALTYLVSISIRHERFAEALVRKAPRVKLENVLTISADVDPFVENIRDAVNYFGPSIGEEFEGINLQQARQIFETLSCGRQNTKLLDAPGGPYPLLVTCSETGVIRPIFGARAEPVRFLLESLRLHYPKDYDINQASREASLQRAMRRVLNDGFSNLDYQENVTMRLNDRIFSDIDLVVSESTTGTILLCQLKHQELYGSDFHAQTIRTSRLKAQVKTWLDAVDGWVEQLGMEGVRSALRLPRDWSQELRLYRIVVSRHFAYPLGDIVTESNSAYANWIQFFNAIGLLKRDRPDRTLLDLVSVLQETQSIPEKVTHLPEPTTRWKIDELVFVTRQDLAEST